MNFTPGYRRWAVWAVVLGVTVLCAQPVFGAPTPAAPPAPVESDEVEPDDEAEGDDVEPAADLQPASPAGSPAAVPAPAEGAGDDVDTLSDLDDLMNDDTPAAADVQGWEEVKAPREYPYFEHHGYFRFRTDLFWRAHLGTQKRWGEDSVTTTFTSGVKPPLSENAANNDSGNQPNDPRSPNKVGEKLDENVLAGANLRFRYTPTIHLSPDLRIKAQFDVLDNLVMGSTPDFSEDSARPDVPLSFFSGTQVSPESGRNSWRDAVRVKQLYGEWRSLIGLLRVGRQANHWGMGLLANGGQDDDSDYGDYVDRAMWLGRFWKINTSLAFDWVSTGPTNESAGEYFGQPRDLEDADDAWEIVASVFMRPTTDADQALRIKDLQARKVAFDWGLYYVFRHQTLALGGASEAGLDSGNWSEFTSQTDAWDGLQLVHRGAQAHIADAWLRLEWRPKFGHKLHLETEWAVIYGHIDNANAGGGETHELDIIQFGGVLQADYTWLGLNAGFELGVASGDEAEGFGVLDRSNLTYNRITRDAQGNAQSTPTRNRRLSNFIFDRDYIVDLMLFREVIGAVTNTVYIKPFVSYDLFESEEDALGARLDILYAAAMEPRATPGNGRHLGLEFDLRIFYEEKRKFAAMLEWGTLVPFSAFDNLRPVGADGNLPGRVEAKWATTLQARVLWKF